MNKKNIIERIVPQFVSTPTHNDILIKTEAALKLDLEEKFNLEIINDPWLLPLFPLPTPI